MGVGEGTFISILQYQMRKLVIHWRYSATAVLTDKG